MEIVKKIRCRHLLAGPGHMFKQPYMHDLPLQSQMNCLSLFVAPIDDWIASNKPHLDYYRRFDSGVVLNKANLLCAQTHKKNVIKFTYVSFLLARLTLQCQIQVLKLQTGNIGT